MRKLPNGISNYEKIIEENRIYVDKTMYIEKMEDLADSTIMFLRPRKFGKTLFTSTLECYYDKNRVDKFEKLFGKTYIGKNPTPNKNRYCILRFNFSGISTNTVEETMKGFREKVDLGINRFVADYEIEFYNNPEQSTEGILGSIFEAFRTQRRDEKIYVIIDEYDHFANELLGFRTDEFKELVAKNGKIRKWYEILKEGTESVVDRIFITGVAPITLDSTTSGFNIANDITKDIEFNDMLGFNKEDVKYLMKEIDMPEEKQEEVLPIIKENYDGYIFSDEIDNNELNNYKLYNSNMTLYFLNEYCRLKEIPKKLVDINILSDYRKIEAFMDLCQNMNKIELLEKSQKEQVNEVEKIKNELLKNINNEKEKLKNDYFEKIDITEINRLLNSTNLSYEIEKIQSNLNEKNIELHRLELDKENILPKLEELAENEEKLTYNKEIYEELKEKNNAINLAKQALETAYQKMKNDVTPKFTQKLSENINNITNGKYNKVIINEEDGIIIELPNGEYKNANTLSVGTIQQLYMAFRLSMAEDISDEEMPIILDEIFAFSDDSRMEDSIKNLYNNYANSHQILLFTCTNREEQILQKLNFEYNKITL